MAAAEDAFFNDQAEQIFKSLNITAQQNKSLWSKLDAIYEHPDTKAKVYIGGESAAKDGDILDAFNITRVVNCTTDIVNKFEKEGKIKYERFCIATWQYTIGYRFNFPSDSEEFKNKEILRYADSILDVLDEFLDNGESILIHCLAGAHRAGTMGVLFIMGKMKTNSKDAIKFAKRLRPLINPIHRLQTYLERVDTAVQQLNDLGAIAETSRWYRPELAQTEEQEKVLEKVNEADKENDKTQ